MSQWVYLTVTIDVLTHQEKCYDFATRFASLLIGRVGIATGRVQNEECLGYSLVECDKVRIWKRILCYCVSINN